MTLFNAIKKYLTKSSDHIETPENTCPNCWGRQEYEGQFRQAITAEHINLLNVDQYQGWIQAYATKQFQGIQLKSTQDDKYCPTCVTN